MRFGRSAHAPKRTPPEIEKSKAAIGQPIGSPSGNPEEHADESLPCRSAHSFAQYRVTSMPTPTSSASLELPDAAATESAGARLAGQLRAGMIVTVSGDLGAGKTTLVRGCLRALGWAGIVKSPSYTLVEHYPFSSLYFYHFDFYRFDDSSEWETAGLADCFRDDSVCLVEWPERVAGLLPTPDLELILSHPVEPGCTGRRLVLMAHTEAGERCLTAITCAGTGAQT
jgi:tRNA threonylcarbamoyladenosine biosynthesis protein TsaE